MYLPKTFEETDQAQLHQFIRAHPLATLVTHDASGLCANHIPMLVEAADAGHFVLQGHVARANPLWREVSSNADALAIFQDQGMYVTPSWYPSKRETGMVVPTWNYSAVHVSGTVRAIEDADWLLRFLTRLTAANEAAFEQPWLVTDAPDDYIQRQLRAIVGIELSISRMAGKFKVSQNRSDADANGVAQGLASRGTPADRGMAALITKRRPPR